MKRRISNEALDRMLHDSYAKADTAYGVFGEDRIQRGLDEVIARAAAIKADNPMSAHSVPSARNFRLSGIAEWQASLTLLIVTAAGGAGFWALSSAAPRVVTDLAVPALVALLEGCRLLLRIRMRHNSPEKLNRLKVPPAATRGATAEDHRKETC